MPLPHDPTERSAVEEVSRAIAEASAAAGTDPAIVHSVCVGIPGYVDPGETGELFSEALPGWPVRGLKEILETELGRTVHIENDVNLAAVAERQHGAGVDSDVFALLWLGNGVGASFDVAGDLHRGAFGAPARSDSFRSRSAANALDPSAHTAQDLVGGRAVALLARRHGLDVSGYHAARSALAEPDADAARAAVFHDLAERVAHVALPLLATLDPGHLVLAGPSASLGGEAFADEVGRGIRRLSRWYPEVVATRSTAIRCSSARASWSPAGCARNCSTRSRASASPDPSSAPRAAPGVGTGPRAVVVSPVVRLRSSGDRAPVSGTVGRGFESLRGHFMR